MLRWLLLLMSVGGSNGGDTCFDLGVGQKLTTTDVPLFFLSPCFKGKERNGLTRPWLGKLRRLLVIRKIWSKCLFCILSPLWKLVKTVG